MFIFLNANEVDFKNTNIVFSQTTDFSCSISFDELLGEGLGFHPSMSMSKELVKGAEYKLDSAGWGYYPTPSLDFSIRDKNRKQLTARIDQPLWTGGKLDASYDKALANQEEAINSYDEQKFNLIEEYLNTLQNYLHAQKKLIVLEENKIQFHSLSQTLQRMIDAGMSGQIDKELLESRLVRVYSDLDITKAKLKVSKIKFEILSAKKIECVIEFDNKEIFTSAPKIDSLIEELFLFSPSLKIVDSKIDASISDISSAESKLWPSLILRGEHRSSGGLYEDGIQATDENLLYLTLQVSTGAGLSALSEIDSSKVNVIKTRYDKKIKEKELVDNLTNDYIGYVTAKSEVEILLKNIVTLSKIYESNKRLYLLQKKQWLDLVNSLSELNQQKIRLSEEIVKKMILEYKIALKTGKINLDTGEIIK